MIFGIGTDLLKMDSIPSFSLKKGDPFYEKMFTEMEKLQAEESPDREDYLRRRFCAKEAVFKTLKENPEHARICEIEILDDEDGAPSVTLHGTLGEHARRKGIVKIHVSLSSEKEYALAFAVAQQGKEDRL